MEIRVERRQPRSQESRLDPRSTLVGAYRVAAALTAGLILLQAALAGRFLFTDPDLVDVHEVVANIITGVVFALLGLAFLAPFANRIRIRAWTSALTVLIIAQTGLGYAGRDDSDLASIHVPIGVLLFGVSVLVLTLSMVDVRREGDSDSA